MYIFYHTFKKWETQITENNPNVLHRCCISQSCNKMEQTTYTRNNWDESQGLSERSQFLKMTRCKCPFNDILKKKNSRGRDQTSGFQELGWRGCGMTVQWILSLLLDENVLELVNDDGGTILRMYQMPLSCPLKRWKQ